jgi:hypothetical protein
VDESSGVESKLAESARVIGVVIEASPDCPPTSRCGGRLGDGIGLLGGQAALLAWEGGRITGGNI